jgi:hypothetical protein
VFTLTADPSFPPSCSALLPSLSTSQFWNPASHPSPAIVTLMANCIQSPIIDAFVSDGSWPLSMRLDRVAPDSEPFASSSASASASASNTSKTLQANSLLFHSVLDASNAHSSTCSELLRVVDAHSSYLIFLLR